MKGSRASWMRLRSSTRRMSLARLSRWCNKKPSFQVKICRSSRCSSGTVKISRTSMRRFLMKITLIKLLNTLKNSSKKNAAVEKPKRATSVTLKRRGFKCPKFSSLTSSPNTLLLHASKLSYLWSEKDWPSNHCQAARDLSAVSKHPCEKSAFLGL